ncbi:MAG: hypothetical protein ACR2ML_07830 [Solirubrobacteraceae bacterium]
MSNTAITYLVISCAAVFALAAFVAFIVVPAWKSYGTVWERIAASFMSLYVLATFAGMGILIGAAIFFYSDNL